MNRLWNKLKKVYEEKYKLLMVITLSFTLLSLLQIGMQYYTTGDFVHKGTTLKGGSTITITKVVDVTELQSFLHERFPKAEINVRTITTAGKVVAVAVDSDAQEKSEVSSLVEALTKKIGLDKEDYSVETIGSSLGTSFFKQIVVAVLIAFLLMSIVVVIYFRSLAPSMMVVLCAFSDIVITLAIFNLTGIRLSTAGVAAFLMLIGYSVDTDILLSTRVLKRKEGTVVNRIYGAIKTGLTMTITSLAVIIVSLIFVQSEVIKQIMIILLIGLSIDILMTWVQNAGFLRWYLERKQQ